MTVKKFQTLIRSWFTRHGRHTLPWRRTHNPYRILVSEIMLQQTQVSRVIPKYREFMSAFPSLRALDRTPLASVLKVWSGLGYNRRATYLKRLARIVVGKYRGKIPDEPELLQRLPGIGPATAGAIAAFAFGKRAVCIETNIRRVYINFFFPNRPRIHDREIMKKIEATLPRGNIRGWYYALMDYGAAAFQQKPNPNRKSVHYTRQPPFRGSPRALRGRIVAEVIVRREMRTRELRERMGRDLVFKRYTTKTAFEKILTELETDGLITTANHRIRIAR